MSHPRGVALHDILSDWFVVMPSVWLAEFAHRAGAKVWQYTFGNWGQGDFTGAAPADLPTAEALSAKMMDAFASFAKHGTPATRALPHCPAFTPRDRACVVRRRAEPGARPARRRAGHGTGSIPSPSANT